MDSWICSTCGQSHEGVATGYGYEAPWTWYTVAEAERAQRCLLNADYCVIDNGDFFVRGCLEIPIIGREEPFIWGVWVSLSKANFEREQNLANNPERIKEPAYFGCFHPASKSIPTQPRSRPTFTHARSAPDR